MKMIHEFIATGFFSGYFNFAPGTAGTWVALCILVFTKFIFDFSNLEVGIFYSILFSCLTLISAGQFAKEINEDDPASVVMDEFAGMAFAFIFTGPSVASIVLSFVLFRLFDILKPFPINKLQEIPGALGILVDDLLAGLYAGFLIIIFSYFFPSLF